jgi:hypothetical protein
LHQPLYLTYALFIEAGHRLATGDPASAERLNEEALALGRKAHGANAEIFHGGIRFLLAQYRGDLAATLPESERMATLHPRLSMWKIAILGALIDAGRREEAHRILASFVNTRAVKLRDNQIFLPAACALAQAAADLGDAERAAVLHRVLEPYAERLAVSGLGGISVGPVSWYAGLAAHTAGDLQAAERLLTAAVADSVRHGLRAYEARARADLGRVLARRAETAARGEAELRRAGELAAELDLVLPTSR